MRDIPTIPLLPGTYPLITTADFGDTTILLVGRLNADERYACNSILLDPRP
jgi:hypothetical protein